jgi:hypothetical protein
MRKREKNAVCCLVVLAVSSAAAQATAHLSDYHSVVRFAAENRAVVNARIAVQPALDRVVISRQNGQQVTEISVRQEGVVITANTIEGVGAWIVKFAAGTAIDLSYTVTSQVRLTRVPLPVVEVPPLPQQRPVLIEADLIDGTVAVGGSFPALTWHASHGEARFAAAPSVLVIEARAAGSISAFDRLTTPTAMSTWAMFVFLFAGSLVWFARTRSARAKAARQ